MHCSNRRIAAIVLNNLACDIVQLKRGPDAASQGKRTRPLAVIVEHTPHAQTKQFTEEPSAKLSAVDPVAFHYGLRPGQSVAEAMAFVSQLDIVGLNIDDIEQARSRVAESVLRYGTTAATNLASSLPN